MAGNCHTCGGLFFLNPLVNFLAVDRYVLGGLDSDSYLVAFDAKDSDCYVITDNQGLSDPSCKDQHNYPLDFMKDLPQAAMIGFIWSSVT